MNYLHPSLIKPVHGDYYVVICEDAVPRVVQWRRELGEPGKGGYGTFVRLKRTTSLTVLEGVLLVSELSMPTKAQLDAAALVHVKLTKA